MIDCTWLVLLFKKISVFNAAFIVFLIVGCQQNTSDEKKDKQSGSSVRSTPKMQGMVLVPGGEFIMGSDRVDDSGKQQEYGLVNPLYLDEHPRHKRTVEPFYIDIFEVSNAQYKQFTQSGGAKEPFPWTQNGYNLIESRLRVTDLGTLRWIASEYFQLDMDTGTMDKTQLLKALVDTQSKRDRLPVTGVTWSEAAAYCQWAGKRLPTEPEWEKAARGTQGFIYPWGNQWIQDYVNTGDDSSWEEGIAPVGSYPNNKSPYGVYDMSGNVWEWVQDTYQPYPGSDYKHKDFNGNFRVIRGGGGGIGHYALSVFFRSSARSYAVPLAANNDVGFRCAKNAY